MNKIILTKNAVFVFGILTILFLVAFYTVAWQEPASTPPVGNVPTPLNVGSEDQSKEGGLTLNTEGGTVGLVVENGQVCIGTDCRDSWPETGVVTTYRLQAAGYQVGNNYYSKSVSYTCPEDSTVVNIYLSTSNVTIQSSQGGGCNWGCQSGMCNPYQSNSCSYSVSGSTATLLARIVQTYEVDCSCCRGYSLVNSCYPHRGDYWGYPIYGCYIPGGCTMEFQCGIKQTVGQ